MEGASELTREQRWLAALWPKVRGYLAPAPGMVIELGCGRFGGFVPNLQESGYEAVGVDPAAPEHESYRRTEFERSDLAAQAEAIVACLSLHHVGDPDEVLNKAVDTLVPGGLMIVVEWDWEGFDEATARWCFERLDESAQDSWLHHRRDEWTASGETWEQYLSGWAHRHGLHSARRLLPALDERFQRLAFTRGPYFFPELIGTSEADEVAAINASHIRPARIDYVGRRG